MSFQVDFPQINKSRGQFRPPSSICAPCMRSVLLRLRQFSSQRSLLKEFVRQPEETVRITLQFSRIFLFAAMLYESFFPPRSAPRHFSNPIFVMRALSKHLRRRLRAVLYRRLVCDVRCGEINFIHAGIVEYNDLSIFCYVCLFVRSFLCFFDSLFIRFFIHLFVC